jgi:dienelactone hydrolase
VTILGDGGAPITAYVAKPLGAGPFPGVVLIHHLPGWSERTPNPQQVNEHEAALKT